MTRLSETEVFLAVAQHGGVTQAALALGVSKSAVSKQLSALEDRLGVRLLHRTTRALALTSDGDIFFAHASQAMEELAEAERAVQGSGDRLTGTLRISIPGSFGLRYLGGPIAAFSREHPEVRLEVNVSDRKVDLVEEGYDVAVRGGALRSSSLVARRLAPMSLLPVASPAFVARSGPIERPSDLEALPALIYRQRDSSTTLPLRRGDGADGHRGELREVRMSGPMVSDSGDLLLEAARAGLGWVAQPDFLVSDDIRAGRLVRLLPAWDGPDSAMWVVYPHRRHLSSRVRVFVEHLLRAFVAPPWRDPGAPDRDGAAPEDLEDAGA